MVNLRLHALCAITAILVFGTAYSVLYSTYLDTSNPLLTSLPHPLSKTHFFASKANPLNTVFIKHAWGWSSLSFFFNFFTSPPGIRTTDRLFRYITLTALWFLFVDWFFGPAILTRLVIYSGGECIATMPSGEHVSVSNDLCLARATISSQTHPNLFNAAGSFRVRPRLRKGHDVSGHVFLLTMSTLFLVDQLSLSLSLRASRCRLPPLHSLAVKMQIVLVFIWLFSLSTTALYFHTPFEKLTGYILGVASFALSQLWR